MTDYRPTGGAKHNVFLRPRKLSEYKTSTASALNFCCHTTNLQGCTLSAFGTTTVAVPWLYLRNIPLRFYPHTGLSIGSHNDDSRPSTRSLYRSWSAVSSRRNNIWLLSQYQRERFLYRVFWALSHHSARPRYPIQDMDIPGASHCIIPFRLFLTHGYT